ncbi:MAG: NAD(P)-dependent alcohol dehydrogenase [Bacteroidetes bacterium]|nr:NAD(P)-dependent alcohol dehydrogenase [Bacteroidota bacterium]NOG57152.1 NAD(P)-dependent alcohol dehydrogenase [Bacteroidota bacterium]
MKAAIRRKYGDPKHITIEEIERPIPNQNQVLIKVHATTVNRTDCANLSAKPFIMRFFLGLFKPKKIIIGTDFAGEIISIGNDVNDLPIGDRVFGFTDSGSESQAEYCVADPIDLYCIPNNLTYAQAVASLEGAFYAYAFIYKTQIKAGQKILINGATGAIGSALLQFAKQKGVSITATCNTNNIALIQSLGASKIVDYTHKDFTDTHEKFDFIFDTVGKSTFGKCKKILTDNGIYISSELGPYAQNVFYPILTSFSNKKVIFPIPLSKSKTLPYIINKLKSKEFNPVIDRTYPLEDISKAYEYVLTGQKTGNVIIQIAAD